MVPPLSLATETCSLEVGPLPMAVPLPGPDPSTPSPPLACAGRSPPRVPCRAGGAGPDASRACRGPPVAIASADAARTRGLRRPARFSRALVPRRAATCGADSSAAASAVRRSPAGSRPRWLTLPRGPAASPRPPARARLRGQPGATPDHRSDPNHRRGQRGARCRPAEDPAENRCDAPADGHQFLDPQQEGDDGDDERGRRRRRRGAAAVRRRDRRPRAAAPAR